MHIRNHDGRTDGIAFYLYFYATGEAIGEAAALCRLYLSRGAGEEDDRASSSAGTCRKVALGSRRRRIT